MPRLFCKEKMLRFSHCDPAGIGFYPRYVELINEVVEDWCNAGSGTAFHDMHRDHGVGLPTVRLEMDFFAPIRLGEVLSFGLKVTRMGRSAMDLEIEVRVADQLRQRARMTVVFSSLKLMKSVPIDGIWREHFVQYLHEAA